MMLNGVDLPAEEAVRRGYEELRQETERAVSSKLRARGMHVDPADLDALYNQAWHALYTRLAEGEEVENPSGFLVQVMFFRGVDEYRRLRPSRRADSVDTETLADSADPDQAIDDRDRIRSFVEGMKDRLTARESQAAALCYLQGFSRPEAASMLGLSEKRMQKLMDAVSKKVGIFAREISSGAWCESRDSLVKAYALGLLDPEGERYRLAAVHLRGCAGCRRRVLALRGIAAIVPPVALPWTLLGAGGASAGGGSAAAGSGALAGGAGATQGAVAAASPGGTIAAGNPGGIAASAGASGPAGGAPANAGTVTSSAGGTPAGPGLPGGSSGGVPSPGGSVGVRGVSRLRHLTPRATAAVAVTAVAVAVAGATFAVTRGGGPDTPAGPASPPASEAAQGSGGAGGAGTGGAGAGGKASAAPGAGADTGAAAADEPPPKRDRDRDRATDGKPGDNRDEPPAGAGTVPGPTPAADPAPPAVLPTTPAVPAPIRDTGTASPGAVSPGRATGKGDPKPGAGTTKDGGSVADAPPLEDAAQEFDLAP